MTAFPEGFQWGLATAAHQVEGNNQANDYWLLENVEGTVFAEPSGSAIDHYSLFESDIALIAGLGFTTYRFSVEWSRIEPAPGDFSHEAVEHYRRVLEACHRHGLRPIVTYHHFSSPTWLIARGGWENPETVDLFAAYAAFVTRELGHLMSAVCTMNEPNLADLIHNLGILELSAHTRAGKPMFANAARRLGIDPEKFASFQFSAGDAAFAVKHAAHRAAVEAIHGILPDLPAGWTLANSAIQSLGGSEERAETIRINTNIRYLEASRGDDFVGIQTYGRSIVGPDGLVHAGDDVEKNQLGEEIYPFALEQTIREAWSVAETPVLVTENGLATEDDFQRVRYVQTALEGVRNCLRDGIDVRGYIAWSAFDNFEWIFGYRPKFGFIGVDRETQRRLVKPSGQWLGAHAASNGRML
ncbi:glycoside hydrolase family 1 protein [Microbacterium sp. BH-3-3-3]|uniref:glycoside hydrolase family 1 protein n=1 Tax=Microbacterium sp. BH-3-3-3 TaxID=1906742 RepID=UPI00119D3FF9|nr:family 1 glycosylhydrolase [Microbacterium sp. BH-3-3-3]